MEKKLGTKDFTSFSFLANGFQIHFRNKLSIVSLNNKLKINYTLLKIISLLLHIFNVLLLNSKLILFLKFNLLKLTLN